MKTPPCMVWLPADHRLLGDHGHQMPFLLLGDKYARAVKVGAACPAGDVPAGRRRPDPELLPLVDGVMLTGSPSNVHPSHFDEDVADPSLPLDPVRDSLTLALVKACVHEGVPLLGICRGFQEINVALGGTLHQRVHEVPGRMDHREPKTAPFEEQYAPRHPSALCRAACSRPGPAAPRPRSTRCTARASTGCADGLDALAHAPDGVIEALAVQGARTFAYAVQFHPEWRCWETRFYTAIFEAFGKACRQRRSLRLQAADLSRRPDPPHGLRHHNETACL
jgi:putative glutamine amidotransferase